MIKLSEMGKFRPESTREWIIYTATVFGCAFSTGWAAVSTFQTKDESKRLQVTIEKQIDYMQGDIKENRTEFKKDIKDLHLKIDQFNNKLDLILFRLKER